MKKVNYQSVLNRLVPAFIMAVLMIFSGGGALASNAKDQINLKLSVAFPPKAFAVSGILEPWAKEIETATNGQVKITIFAGETLGKHKDQYDMVVTRICDIAMIETEITPGRFPLSEIDWMPMLFPSAEVTGRVYHSLLEKYAVSKELHEVKLLFVAPLPPAQLISSKPIKSLEDVKGMKIQTAGKVESWVASALKARPVAMAKPEIYTALERGVIDGTFIVWEGALAFRAHEVTKYRTEANIFTRGLPVVMNRDVWEKLSPDIQVIISAHSGIKTSARYGAAFDQADQGAKKAIMGFDAKVGNPGIFKLSETEKQKWQKALKPVWEKWVQEKESAGLPGRAILDDAIQMVGE